MQPESIGVFRSRWPLYLAEFCLLLAVISATGSAMREGFPYTPFVVGTLVTCCLGLVLRHFRLENEIGIYVLCSVGALVWFVPSLRESIIGRYEQLMSGGVPFGASLSVVLLCLSMGLASVATTDSAVAFVIVPCVSAFGTCAEVSVGAPVVAAFMLFVFASVFVLSYQHIFTKTRLSSGESRVGQSAGSALLFASLFSLLVFFCANVATNVAIRSEGDDRRPFYAPPAADLGLLSRVPLPMSLSFTGDSITLGTIPPPPSNRVAFGVKSDAELLWRMAVYNEYDGRSWTAIASLPLQRIRDARDFGQTAPDRPLKGHPVHQTYQIASLTSASVLAAATPVGIEGVEPLNLVLDPFGCLREPGATHPFATYAVTSLVASATPQELRSASQEIPPYFADIYLRLPESAYRASSVALKVAGNQPTRYDKVIALQYFLEQDFTYTLRPPMLPPGEDFVSWFLTKAKAGYCEAFASAMVVMARSLGIPARLATGFASGEPTPQGSYIVREKDAHAWAEIYFGPDFGWIPFDPQPTKQETVPSGTGLSWFRAFVWPPFLTQASPIRLVVGLMVLCAVVLLVGPLAVRVVRFRWSAPLPPLEDRDRLCAFYADMCSVLARLGLPRSPFQTPLEYLRLLSERLNFTTLDVLTYVRKLTDLFLLACYSQASLSPDDFQAAASSLKSIRSSVRLLRSRR